MNYILLKIHYLAIFHHQVNIFSNYHNQSECISKGKANASIHTIITSMFSHRNLIDSLILSANDLNSLRISSSIEEISYINIIFLNILIIHLKDYEINLNAIKIIIHDNQIKTCQVNLNIFNQLMK